MAELIAPLPNLNSLTQCLAEYIAKHPLLSLNLIKHPLTNKPISLDRFRLYDGIELKQGLNCAVYAHPGGNAKPSVAFEPYDLGAEGIDQATFYIVVKYFYNEIAINNETTLNIPTTSKITVGGNLLTSNIEREVIIELNPGIKIIQEYLALTKYILDDVEYKKDFPMGLSSFTMMYQNVKNTRWEDDTSIYFQEGYALIRLTGYVSRGWRNILRPEYANNLDINTNIIIN